MHKSVYTYRQTSTGHLLDDWLVSILWPHLSELGMERGTTRQLVRVNNCYKKSTSQHDAQFKTATQLHLNNSLVCSSNQCCISIAKLQK